MRVKGLKNHRVIKRTQKYYLLTHKHKNIYVVLWKVKSINDTDKIVEKIQTYIDNNIVRITGEKYILLEAQFLEKTDDYRLGIRKVDKQRQKNRVYQRKTLTIGFCYECRTVLDYKNLEDYKLDNHYYCEDCYNKLFSECYECGERYLKDDLKGYKNDLYCKDCFNKLFFVCSHCNNTFKKGYECVSDINGKSYCEDCYGDLFANCEGCGEEFYRDDLNYDDYNSVYYCNDCWQENSIIKSYTYRPKPVFAKEPYENTLYMGFELEVEAEKSVRGLAERLKGFLEDKGIEDRFYFKDDGSLTNGFEIVSHPSTTKIYRKYQLKAMLDFLKKQKATSYEKGTCGLHFHLDRKFFSGKEELKLKLLFANCIPQLKKLSQRKDYQFCKLNTCSDYSLKDYKNRQYYQEEKYEAINYNNDTTIEIRLFRGTLDYERFLVSMQFTEAISNFVKEVSCLSMKWDIFKDWLRLTNRYHHLERYLVKKEIGECV